MLRTPGVQKTHQVPMSIDGWSRDLMGGLLVRTEQLSCLSRGQKEGTTGKGRETDSEEAQKRRLGRLFYRLF